ncbi:phosphatase PAP2 family protein [Natronorubrum sp. DTA7]|uniref:phosphatase PAP2 family protein n=1 Tax=Natronorubrum sp. DTA7 TaxID=3447016 RepID=UPI003F82BB03
MWFESAQVELVRDAFPEWMAFLFALLSYLGSVWFVVPAVVLAYWFGDRHRFAPWLGIVIGGYALMFGLKGTFTTPRPGVGPAIDPESLPTVVAVLYAPAVEVSTTSFPSGHVIAATIIWTMVALESDVATKRTRLLGAAAMIVLVGVARVGAGVHFPIDVIVGVIAGVCYLSIALTVRSYARVRGEQFATSATFAVAAVLGLATVWITRQPDRMALFGGCIGALLAWQYATPAREPWPVTLQTVVHAALAIAVLVLSALMPIVSDGALVWLAVGFTAGLIVVGFPRFVDRTAVAARGSNVVS